MTPWSSARTVLFCLCLSAGFLSVAADSPAHLSLIRQHPVESVDFSEDGDNFGYAVVAGDFNGDGEDDLATGAPGDDRDGLADGDEHGLVVITEGSVFGLTHVDAYKLEVDLLSLPIPDSSLRFGHALASGYFNNDAYADLAVGAPWQDFPGSSSGGAVYIYHGGPSGLSSTPAIVLTQESAGETSEIDEWFGWSLAVGDFDGDGRDDLGVGVPGEDTNQGMVCYFYGTNTGLSATGAGFFKQADLGLVANDGDQFGFSLASAHLTETVEDDLAVGEPYDRSSGPTRTGRVTLIPGSNPNGLTSLGSSNFNAPDLGIVTGISDLSLFGWSLAVGRFNHLVGGHDLAIGEPGYPQNALPNSGRVIVQQILGFGSVPRILHQLSVPGTGESIDANDYFGWSLAATTMDSLDYLAVGAPGSPGFDDGPVSNVGAVSLFQADTSLAFPGPTSTSMDADWLFDRDRTLNMGWSLAFGNYDGKDTLNLAIGAPLADYETWVISSLQLADESGQVHIYAPHRQVFQLRARSASCTDCFGNWIQTLRLSDPLQIASTTKAMSAWIAADHLVWDLVDSTDTYTVPEYVADCVSGSQVGLIEGETYEFWELFQLMVSESGNDASYSIGDLLTGKTWNWPDDCDGDLGGQISAFADSMNYRALDVGMPYTFFNNPAGRPFPKFGLMPFSTALGMDIMGRAAMQNPVYRQVVATTDWVISTDTDSVLDGSNGWLKGLQSSYNSPNSAVIGIKPGRNDPSLSTRLVAAGADTLPGDVIATIFGVDGGGWADARVLDLAALAAANCPSFGPVTVDHDTIPVPMAQVDEIPSSSQPPGQKKYKIITGLGVNEGGGGDIGSQLLVELYRQDRVTSTAMCSLSVEFGFDYRLRGLDTGGIIYGPFSTQKGLRIFNEDSTQAELFITHNQPLGTSFALTLPAYSDSVVLGPSSFAATDFSVTVQNIGSVNEAVLHVEFLGFDQEVTLGEGGRVADVFSASITMDQVRPRSTGNLISRIQGLDPPAGPGASSHDPPYNTLIYVVREPGVQTGVVDLPGGPVDGGSGVIGLLASYPNPSGARSTIEYRLSEPADVFLTLFDVRGRLVRVLESTRDKPAGRHVQRWDGLDGNGRTVASGVYFYRLVAGTETRVSRLVVLR